MPVISLILLGGILSLYIILTLARKWQHYLRLAQFEGPSVATISHLWLLRQTLSGQMHLRLYETCKKYGKIVRIAPDTLIVSDVNIWRNICAVRSPYIRASWYQGMKLEPGIDNILTYGPEKHMEIRSKMAMGFSGRENPNWESTVDGLITSMLDLIESKYIKNHKPIDWGTMAANLTLDVVTELGFSHCMGNIKHDRDLYNYHGSVSPGLRVQQVLNVYPSLISLLERMQQTPLLNKPLPGPEDKDGWGRLVGFAKARATERFSPNTKNPNDMLASFARQGITKEEAEANVAVQMTAGTDPGATALRVAVLYISTNAHIHRRLLSELSSFGLLTISSISSIVSLKTCRQLPYLQACVKETLRIFPPFCGLSSKAVPEGGDYLDGKFVPEGTSIGFCYWAAMRDTDVFGEDADVFRPERWLETTEEARNCMERSLECVFSPGRYTCLGKDLAILQLNKVIVEFFRRYDIALVDPLSPWESKAFGIFLQRYMWVRVNKREE